MLLAFDRPIWNGDAMRIQKASERLALNLPHTSSSHLDALTCTLHNAWAAWIYITPLHCSLTHTHNHKSTCTTMQKHTSVWQWCAPTRWQHMRTDKAELKTKQPKNTDFVVRIWYIRVVKEEKQQSILSQRERKRGRGEGKTKLFGNLEVVFGNFDLLIYFLFTERISPAEEKTTKKNDVTVLKALIAMKHVGATSSKNCTHTQKKKIKNIQFFSLWSSGVRHTGSA